MTRPNPNIANHITEVQFNLGALLALLGGTSEERLRFYEIVKGITSVATFEVLQKELAAINEHVGEAQAGLRTVLSTVSAEAGQAA